MSTPTRDEVTDGLTVTVTARLPVRREEAVAALAWWIR